MASATNTKRRSAAQLAADGFAALVEKLGMAEAVRYLQLYDQGTGDYARQRHEWLDELSREQIWNLMAQTKKPNPRKRKGRKPQKGGGEAIVMTRPAACLAAGGALSGGWPRGVSWCRRTTPSSRRCP